MKKIIPAIILILMLVSCTNKIYNSAGWQSQKVNIDGKINEWSNPLRFYDRETGINYNISNDRYNLYFACSISNEILQTKILRSGLEFRIDTLGKREFGVSFKYPIGNQPVTEPKPDNLRADEGGFNKRPDRSAFKLKLLAEATEIKLVGFKLRLGKILSLATDKSGISAAINIDANGIMDYEAVIPFSTFYRSELIPADSSAIFNFQIKINPLANSGNAPGTSGGMTRGGMRGGGGRPGGGMPGGGMPGGGMPGGGGMGGGRPGEFGGNGSQGNSNMSAVTKTTIKLKLAYK